MNRGIAWLACNPVAANLLAALIVAAGLLAGTTVIDEAFPEGVRLFLVECYLAHS